MLHSGKPYPSPTSSDFELLYAEFSLQALAEKTNNTFNLNDIEKANSRKAIAMKKKKP